MSKGIILKGIGGFYYVETPDKIVECRARGIFRKNDIKPLPGDLVEIEELDDGSGSVIKIFPRKNQFVRPPLANVDCLVMVAAVDNPKPDLKFIDKMLVIAESKGVKPVICLNKCDLEVDYSRISDLYKHIGYTVIETSTINQKGIETLKSAISGKITAFAGFSGVGKSSLLNEIFGDLNLLTGDVSKKLNRGRHTTRHIELYKTENNSYIADTPGFSMLEVYDVEYDDLQKFFIEFGEFVHECKFSGCSHLGGKQCGVIRAVEDKKIPQSRYENYLELYNALKNSKENY